MAAKTGLYLRFALAAATVIAVVGGTLLWSLRAEERDQAQKSAAAHAQFIAHSILASALDPTTVDRPVRGADLTRLDRLFTGRVLVDGALRVKLYSSDGVVVYSNVHSLIGTRTDDPGELTEVLGGKTVRDVSTLNHEGGPGRDVKSLEVYVPLDLRGGRRMVFEVYQSYAPVAEQIRTFLIPVAALLAVGLLGLWVILFPLVQRMVAMLDRQRTALEETSEQLRQSQKMEAVGRLAGGVAHDFNNLLLAINGYAEFLVDQLQDARLARYAREIAGAGARAAGLTQQLLAFSRRQVLQPRVIDLNASVRELESILRRVIGEGVEVVLDLDPRLHRIEADPSQIGQVLLNLAVNGRDAMDGRGTLRIATRDADGGVVIQVTDSGTGMDEVTRSRIFEPFFTTKDVGQGTGLGLSTVYGIVMQSRGTIEVDSSPGNGATFRLWFPATESIEDAETQVASVARGDNERILVVDDDPTVGKLVGQMLAEEGYEAEVVASAQAARALDGPWRVLITDVVMPETDGVALAKTIDADHVLFMSGYDQAALVASDAGFLQKPFTRDELSRNVRRLLDPV